VNHNQADIFQEAIIKGEPLDKHDPCDEIKFVCRDLYGNGTAGLVKTAQADHEYILKQIGSFATIKWLLGLLGIGELLLIAKAFLPIMK